MPTRLVACPDRALSDAAGRPDEGGWIAGPPPSEGWTSSGRFAAAVIAALVIVSAVVAFVLVPRDGPPAVGADRPGEVDAVIVGSAPLSWDPQAAGDAASAGTLAQVFEGLTAFDAQSQVQPALARQWSVEDEGRRLVFELRPGITFSDGSPITAEDVVASWLRLIDPQRPSPLASLLSDVIGADQYRLGAGSASEVGLRADGDRLTIEFRRPASYFVAVTASPSLAVMPAAQADQRPGGELPADMVVSGAYLPVQQTATAIRLEANERYWAGPPALGVIELLTDLEGQSPVALFEAERVDHVGVGSLDASWLRYDPDLGPQLRNVDALSVDYYGFDSTAAPFDDRQVRLAFSLAVDWDRLVSLTDAGTEPAASLVPVGVPGRPEGDFSPDYDPAAARAALADAGYPDGRGFPAVTLTSSGSTYDEAVAEELNEVLGVTIEVELRPFGQYLDLLESDPPAFWALSWIADYPHPHDFLGLLLQTGSSSNQGGWSDAEFDATVEAAASTDDPLEQAGLYAQAQRIVQTEAPLIPVAYGERWSLSRDGLLGAGESGVGFLRLAGLAWSDGR